MVRVRTNASIRMPSNQASAEANQLESWSRCAGQHNTASENSDDEEESSSFPIFIGLLTFLGGVAIGIVECIAAGLGLAASIRHDCPTELARNLLSAGVTVIIGCAPLAAARVRDILYLKAAMSKRRIRRAQVKAESAIVTRQQHQLKQQRESNAPSTVIVITSAGSSVIKEHVPAPSAFLGASTVTRAEVHKAGEADCRYSMDFDLLAWAVMQLGLPQLKLLFATPGSSPNQSLTSTLRRFVAGVWRFYRPEQQSEHDIYFYERRRLVVALLFLPMSCTYALLLASQFYVVLTESPGPKIACQPSKFLSEATKFAVWLRVGLASLALVICLFGTIIDLLQRRIRRNRLSERLS